MTDNQLTPTGSRVGDSLGATAPITEKSTAKPPRRGWLGYAVLLSVASMAAGGYFLMQQIRGAQEGLGGEPSKEDQAIAKLDSQVSSLQSRFDAMSSQMASMEARHATENSDFKLELSKQDAQFSDKLERVRSNLQADLQGVHRTLGKTRSDWLIADAEYLLSAALQRLHLVGDLKTAIAALEGADERLREAGDPAVFKVREQLANEIRILNAFTPPDLIGTSSRLLALGAKIKELPLFLPHAGMGVGPALPNAAVTTLTPPGEKPLINDIISGIGMEKYISIRRLNKPVSFVLTPEETLVLREILLLKLETARMALVRGDEALYKSSLETARAWLAENFDTDQAAVRSVDRDIKSLMEHPIQVIYPEIGKSLAMLRDITKLRAEVDGAAPNPQNFAGEHVPHTRGDEPKIAPSGSEKGAP